MDGEIGENESDKAASRKQVKCIDVIYQYVVGVVWP